MVLCTESELTATPARAAISQYVDVAHSFYGGDEPGMVNAVLDRVGREVRSTEFGIPAAPPKKG